MATTKKKFGSFQEMLTQSEVPVLVDFYAHWCGPCKMMTPVLEQVKGQMKDKLQVAKIDTEKYPQLASTYQIYALPTLVLFKDGNPVERIEGYQNAEQLLQRLQPLL
ncbi:MAG: thioredoxin [Leptolyngbyaceae bacterium]|nr:thioredoxin [Leptolyngbyaceae bacterium]